MGSGGVQLGTVAGTDATGNVQLTTSTGAVTMSSALITNTDGHLVASTTSQKDLAAMAATQQGNPEAAAQASTRTASHTRHRNHVASTRAHRVPVSDVTTGTDARTMTDAQAPEQAMPPAETQQPTPQADPALTH